MFSRLSIVKAVKNEFTINYYALVVAGADPDGRDDWAITLPLLISLVIGLIVALLFEVYYKHLESHSVSLRKH